MAHRKILLLILLLSSCNISQVSIQIDGVSYQRDFSSGSEIKDTLIVHTGATKPDTFFLPPNSLGHQGNLK